MWLEVARELELEVESEDATDLAAIFMTKLEQMRGYYISRSKESVS